jgi:hypothetical protein
MRPDRRRPGSGRPDRATRHWRVGKGDPEKKAEGSIGRWQATPQHCAQTE